MIQPTRRRIRTYLPEWLLAWGTVATAAVLRWCGKSLIAYRLLKRFLKRWPRNPVVLAAIIPQAVAWQEDPFAVRMMEELWLNSGHTHYLHRLLFRRSMRPDDFGRRLTLFQLIAASDKLPEHYRWYSLIVISYQAIAIEDGLLIQGVASDLERLAHELASDPATLKCHRSNRENRTKLLVSVYTALSRLYLSLSNIADFESVGKLVSTMVDSIDFDAIDQDSSYRATRNLMRCLAIEVLHGWYHQDSVRWRHACLRLRRAHDHCHKPAFDQSSAQEDHRGFAREMMLAVAAIEDSDWVAQKQDGQIHHLITLIIKTTYEPRFLPKIRAMFAPYLNTMP
jgi:hypothetical protein